MEQCAMRRRPLSLDRLEDRTTPVVWNNPWPDPDHLTLSFAPDGTDVRGAPSQLFGELASLGTTNWQTEVLRAFQTWAAHANINISLTVDNAITSFGAAGPIQGNPLHGDIRIGATELNPAQLAVSTPFDLFGGWTGTVFLNTLAEFATSGEPVAIDLYTVLLQEAGHVLGLGNSPRQDSAMFTEYLGPRVGLRTMDVVHIQSLYGARDPDRFEGWRGNDSLATATRLSFVTSVSQVQGIGSTTARAPYVASGDVTTLGDADVYAIRVPWGLRAFTVSLRTSGVSLLTARLSVLDARGRVVGSVTAADPRTGDLTVNVNGAASNGLYFVKVEGVDETVFAIGAYRVAVGTAAAGAAAALKPSDLIDDDRWGNRSPVFLGNQREGSDLRWDFTHRASINSPADTDTYHVRTKRDTPGTLVVAVWGLEVGRLDPVVAVYDRSFRPVPACVLTDNEGTYTLQVEDAKPNSTYYVRVASDAPRIAANRGSYFLGVDFRDQPVEFQSLVAARLTAVEPDVSAVMTVSQSQLFHFALSVTSDNKRVESAAQLIVLDEEGREVYTLFAAAGKAVSGDVLLAAGRYTLLLTGGARDPRMAMPNLDIRLDGLVRSDPIGLGPTDPAADPAPLTPPPPAEPKPTPVVIAPAPYTGPYTGPYRPQ
jgi:hypothetical protein